MTAYRISPTLSAVLRDLDDMEGQKACSGCGVERRTCERLFYSEYNGRDGVASTDPANMRAPWAEATPSVQGVRHSGVDE